MQKKIQKKAYGVFTIQNDRGLHCRPSTEVVKCSSQFKSDIYFIYRKIRINAKSLLSLLSLSATKGSKIKVEAIGLDSEEAVLSLIDLASQSFKIHY